MAQFDQLQKPAEQQQATTIQPRLEVGSKDDEHEKEANNVASKVMRMSEGSEGGNVMRMQQGPSVMRMQQGSPLMRMHEEDEKKVMKMQEGPSVMRMHEDEEKKVMKMDEGGGGGMVAPANVEAGIQNSKGGGQSLSPDVQQDLGSKMGGDFSDVKIHTDSHAHEMNENINAKAFTHGQDIYFKNGNYNPNSSQGKELLAHELTHTMQQGKGVQRKIQRQNDGVVHEQIYYDYQNMYHQVIAMMINQKFALDNFKAILEAPEKEDAKLNILLLIGKILLNVLLNPLTANIIKPIGDALGALPDAIEKAKKIYETAVDTKELTKDVTEDISDDTKEADKAQSGVKLVDFFTDKNSFIGDAWSAFESGMEDDAKKIEADYKTKSFLGKVVMQQSIVSIKDQLKANLNTIYSRPSFEKQLYLEWLRVNRHENKKKNKMKSGYIEVKVSENWNIESAVIYAPYGKNLAPKLLEAYGGKLNPFQLGIPVKISYWRVEMNESRDKAESKYATIWYGTTNPGAQEYSDTGTFRELSRHLSALSKMKTSKVEGKNKN